ncbi:hypothetical protein WN51_14010 [Melipona quadrifasciata]|uniref:Uncharacterized protein n=1 Tax=Melipona quadrifasciata TaxID=166423 RepID=A0A0N0U553_9HYME|nr:hypothetical protein WN51_14010 [Melipona quadrifasciata]
MSDIYKNIYKKELKERQQLTVQEAKRGNDKHPGEKEERGGGTVSRVRFLPPLEEEDSRLQREAPKEARKNIRLCFNIRFLFVPRDSWKFLLPVERRYELRILVGDPKEVELVNLRQLTNRPPAITVASSSKLSSRHSPGGIENRDSTYPGGNFGNGALVKFSVDPLFVLRSRYGAQRSSDCDARFREWTFRSIAQKIYSTEYLIIVSKRRHCPENVTESYNGFVQIH